MKPRPAFTHSSLVALLLCTALASASSLAADGTTAVAIQNPRLLPPDPIPCERIALGEPDDYKPCIARLPDGELLLTAFHQHKREGNKVMEQTLLFPLAGWRPRPGRRPRSSTCSAANRTSRC